ncbi:cell division [Tritrichomonas musculus]|uniref:Cell division n=1 Tax=Tritrichomonas musculus TaxID=1915356 RepID=A0ABR2GZ74_9EUKA
MNHQGRTSSIAARQTASSKLSAINKSRRVLHEANSKANLNILNLNNKPPIGLSVHPNLLESDEDEEMEIENDDSMSSQSLEPIRLGSPLDTQEVYEYDLEIFNFMKTYENDNLPSPNLFEIQTNITSKMRATVIDWLVEVHKKLKMHTDTLYLTVYLMDSYLSMFDLDKSKYQRLGCAALLIASKSEEIYPPSVHDLVELTEKSFTTIALSRMEALLFASVNFHVNPILPPQFLKRFLRVIRTDLVLSMLSYFILETSLLDPSFIGSTPSLLAASAICLAMTIQNGPGQWTTYMETNTGFALEEITPMVDRLLQCVNNYRASRFPTVRKKYSSAAMGSVSKIAFPEAIKLI